MNRFAVEIACSDQASIRRHLAQIYRQVQLTTEQKEFAIKWLKNLLSSTTTDWIVSANAMDSLAKLTQEGLLSEKALIPLLEIQCGHKTNAVSNRAHKLLTELSSK